LLIYGLALQKTGSRFFCAMLWSKFRAHWRAKFAQVVKFWAFSAINRIPLDRKTPEPRGFA